MIKKEEIQKLATLARIEISEEESEKLSGDIDSILEYIDNIKKADIAFDDSLVNGPYNVLRDDGNSHEKGKYKKELLESAPKSEGDYLKVKNIL